MGQLSITPSITVTIGRHTRLYFAFVTTAPAELDSPSTVTLHASTFSDVAGFAADPITHEELRGRTPARLVLVDAMDSPANAHASAGITTCFRLRIPCSSASTPCSTGCGNASRRPLPVRCTHESRHLPIRVNRSPQWRAFQEVTL